MSEDLRKIQDAILATDPQDVKTINILKAQYQRAQQRAEDAVPRAVAPAAAAGAPDTGGRTGRPSDIPSPRAAAAVVGMAPAKGVAGLLDLGGAGLRKLAELKGIPLPVPPSIVPMVDRLTDELAGHPVPDSIGRSVIEGSIMGPFGGPTTGSLLPSVVAGGVGGGVSQAVKEAGGNPLAQAIMATLSAILAGKATANAGLSSAELFSKPRLQSAMDGLRGPDFDAAAIADRNMRAAGIDPLPSQAFQVDAPGLRDLQGSLLRSRAKGADALRDSTARQAPRVKELVEALRQAGGQTPRQVDDLAAGVQGIVEKQAAAAPKAINEATRPLYNDPRGTAWKISPEVGERVRVGLDEAIYRNRGNEAAVKALQEAQAHLTKVLEFGEPTPQVLAEAVRSVRQNLPAYQAYPQAANQVRRIVEETIAPLTDLVARHAPGLGAAPKMQAQLRADLPSDFNELLRQEAMRGGPEGVVKAATARPEVMGAVADKNELLARELMNWQINQAANRATPLNPRDTFKGDQFRADLTRGPAGQTFQQNLEVLFPKNAAAQEGLRRVLDVVANASQPVGGGTSRSPVQVAAEGVRLAGGSGAQQIGAVARLTNALTGGALDNATIKVLQDPKVIERLRYISNLPKPKLTRVAVMSALPQIFEKEE